MGISSVNWKSPQQGEGNFVLKQITAVVLIPISATVSSFVRRTHLCDQWIPLTKHQWCNAKNVSMSQYHYEWAKWSHHLWWRHQMETCSALLAICAGNSPVSGEFPTQRPVTRRFDVFFDLGLNKRLSKQSWGWWFETLPPPSWRHSNDWFTLCRVTHSAQAQTNAPVPSIHWHRQYARLFTWSVLFFFQEFRTSYIYMYIYIYMHTYVCVFYNIFNLFMYQAINCSIFVTRLVQFAFTYNEIHILRIVPVWHCLMLVTVKSSGKSIGKYLTPYTVKS